MFLWRLPTRDAWQVHNTLQNISSLFEENCGAWHDTTWKERDAKYKARQMNENSMSKKLKWSSSVTQNCFSYKGITWYIKQQLMALHDTLNNN